MAVAVFWILVVFFEQHAGAEPGFDDVFGLLLGAVGTVLQHDGPACPIRGIGSTSGRSLTENIPADRNNGRLSRTASEARAMTKCLLYDVARHLAQRSRELDNNSEPTWRRSS